MERATLDHPTIKYIGDHNFRSIFNLPRIIRPPLHIPTSLRSPVRPARLEELFVEGFYFMFKHDLGTNIDFEKTKDHLANVEAVDKEGRVYSYAKDRPYPGLWQEMDRLEPEPKKDNTVKKPKIDDELMRDIREYNQSVMDSLEEDHDKIRRRLKDFHKLHQMGVVEAIFFNVDYQDKAHREYFLPAHALESKILDQICLHERIETYELAEEFEITVEVIKNKVNNPLKRYLKVENDFVMPKKLLPYKFLMTACYATIENTNWDEWEL